ncbi:MAG: hypothetical protein IT460_14330 [Planctomycetes bacterium]|nr:hypothetical protein [Planctomycetota bacterium]
MRLAQGGIRRATRERSGNRVLAALWASTRDLEAAYWAWYDAYRGRPSEGAI